MFCHGLHAQGVYAAIVPDMKQPPAGPRLPQEDRACTLCLLPRHLPQAGGEDKGAALPLGGRGEKGRRSCRAGCGASGRSIAGGSLLLPRLRGRPGGGLLRRQRKRRARFGKAPSRREALPRPLPQAGGEERGAFPPGGRGEKGRRPGEERRGGGRERKEGAALPRGRRRCIHSFDCWRHASPPPLAGEAGWGSAAAPAEAACTSPAKPRRAGRPSPGPSRKREGRLKGQSSRLAAGKRRGGAPAMRDTAHPVVRLPAARFSSSACGGGREGVCRRVGGKRCARARQRPVAPGGPPPAPPASGRGG